MEPLLLIKNSAAGTADDEAIEAALEVLRAEGDVEVAGTSNPGELDGVLQRAASRTIVVAGGDGSLHAVVAAMHKRNELGDHTLALLPLGTGNDFARALGIPIDPVAAAQVILAEHARPIDVLTDEVGGIVVNNVHLGASAIASRNGATWKSRLGPFGLGLIGYPIGAVVSAVNPPALRLRVEVDGEVVADMDRPVLMVAIGNGTSVGGGTEVTPDADPHDGRADVMISYATSPLARVGYVAQLVRGNHPERDDVSYFRGSTVAVSGEDFHLSADGEISGPESRRTWRLERGAYSMLVPR